MGLTGKHVWWNQLRWRVDSVSDSHAILIRKFDDAGGGFGTRVVKLNELEMAD